MSALSSLQVCTICLDTDSKLNIMSEYSLGRAYENLTGHKLCNGEEIRRYLCSECVHRLINFSKFRYKSLRALSVMEELAGYYTEVTLEHIKLIDRQTCLFTSRLTRTALKQDHCDLYIQHSDEDDTQTDQEFSGGVAVKNEEFDDISVYDEPINITDMAECETDQNYENNLNIKAELVNENDDIHFESKNNNFSVDNTLDLGKGNDGLRKIGRQTYSESEQNYKDNVNLTLEILNENDIDFELTNNNCKFSADSTLILGKEIKNFGTSKFFVDATQNLDTRIDKNTRPENNVLVKKEHNDKGIKAFNQKCDEMLSKTRKKLQDKLVFEMKDTLVSEELKNSKNPNRKTIVNKFELNNGEQNTLPMNCEENTKICEKLGNFNELPKHKPSVDNLDSNSNEQNNLLVKCEQKCDTKPYSCKVCDYKCKLRISMSVHMKMHKDEKRFACNICDYKCKLKMQLNMHILSKHTSEKSYKCEMCPSTFKFKTNMYRHMKEHTCKTPFKCHICDYTTVRKERFLQHTLTHTAEKPFACQLCPSKYSSKIYLKKHVWIHTDVLQNHLNEEDAPFKRHKADKISMETDLSKEKRYRCDLCASEFKKSIHLENHMKTHSGEKAFVCLICEQRFSQKGSLKKHMLTHTNEKPYACDLCDYRCGGNDDLKSHIRRHTGEKPYACTHCERRFSKSYSLATHLRTHTGEKPFSCKICHYKCTRTSHLVRHMRTHTGEKPFSCDLCDFKCTRRCNLLEHMRKHTGHMLSCDYCSYKTTHKSSLTVHIKRHMEIIKEGRTRKPRARKSVASPKLG